MQIITQPIFFFFFFWSCSVTYPLLLCANGLKGPVCNIYRTQCKVRHKKHVLCACMCGAARTRGFKRKMRDQQKHQKRGFRIDLAFSCWWQFVCDLLCDSITSWPQEVWTPVKIPNAKNPWCRSSVGVWSVWFTPALPLVTSLWDLEFRRVQKSSTAREPIHDVLIGRTTCSRPS